MTPAGENYQPLNRWDIVSLLALAALTMTLFLYFLTPPFLSDQLDYFYHGWQTSALRPTHHHLRIGLIFPVWVAIRLFDYSQLGYYAVPALAALSIVSGTWFIGRVLFGRWTGLLAAALLIYNPWVLGSVTDLLPDYPAIGLFTWAVAILLWCWRTERFASKSNSAMFMLLLFVGILIGWSYLTREYAVILFPVAIFSLLVTKSHIRGFIGVALGALSCFLLEVTLNSLWYGDPMARLHAVAMPRSVSAARSVEVDVGNIILQLPHFFVQRSGGLLFFLLLICGAVVGVRSSVQGDRRWQILAFWLVGGWLFFTFVALLPVIWLDQGQVYLTTHKFRYWALILPPLMVAGAGAMEQLIAFLSHRVDPDGTRRLGALATTIVTLLIFLSATLAVTSENYSRLARNGMDDYGQFRKYIETVDDTDEVVLLQLGSHSVSAVRSLPIYLRSWDGLHVVWKGRVSDASAEELDRIIRVGGNKLVAIDLTRLERLRSKGDNLERVLGKLEGSGAKTFESSAGRVVVYRIGRTRDG